MQQKNPKPVQGLQCLSSFSVFLFFYILQADIAITQINLFWVFLFFPWYLDQASLWVGQKVNSPNIQYKLGLFKNKDFS